ANANGCVPLNEVAFVMTCPTDSFDQVHWGLVLVCRHLTIVHKAWPSGLFLRVVVCYSMVFFFSSRRRHTRFSRDWSSDVCSSDLSCGWRCAPGRGSPGRWCPAVPLRRTWAGPG